MHWLLKHPIIRDVRILRNTSGATLASTLISEHHEDNSVMLSMQEMFEIDEQPSHWLTHFFCGSLLYISKPQVGLRSCPIHLFVLTL